MGLCRLREEHASIRQRVEELAGGLPVHLELRELVFGHFAFEESVLFAFLAEHLPADSGPLAVVQEEHEALRPLLARLGEASPPEDRQRLLTLLRAHLEKEEELILPFAHRVLVPEQLARLGCQEPLDDLSPEHAR